MDNAAQGLLYASLTRDDQRGQVEDSLPPYTAEAADYFNAPSKRVSNLELRR